MTLTTDSRIYPRELHYDRRSGIHFFIDPNRPNWAATNDAGARLLRLISEPTTVEHLVEAYEGQAGPPVTRDEVLAFCQDAVDADLMSLAPVTGDAYPGRLAVLTPSRLEEFWVQINDFCNLSCAHCLVSSSPEGGHGLPASTVRDAVEQALGLGAEMIGITGGEAFFRDDLFDLFELILADSHRQVTTLTNGTRLSGKTLERLRAVATDRLELRISLDGPTAEVNDPIRGNGSFNAAVRGIRNALDAGCRVTVTMAVNGANAPYADQMPRLLKELGVKRLHVLWPFQRGRAIEEGQDPNLTPSVQQLIEGYRRIRAAAAEERVAFFTYEAWKVRIDGAPGLKYDLANHCWSSLCLYTNGQVFPSPALTQHPELSLGDIRTSPLRDLWLESDVARRFRAATVVERPQCQACHYRFMCGGGDMDHVYNSSRMHAGGEGDLMADDPYCDLYKEILADALADWTKASPGDDTAPMLIRRMGHRPNRPPKELTAGMLSLATIPST